MRLQKRKMIVMCKPSTAEQGLAVSLRGNVDKQDETVAILENPSQVREEDGHIVHENLAAFEDLHSKIEGDHDMVHYPGSLKLADLTFYTYNR